MSHINRHSDFTRAPSLRWELKKVAGGTVALIDVNKDGTPESEVTKIFLDEILNDYDKNGMGSEKNPLYVAYAKAYQALEQG